MSDDFLTQGIQAAQSGDLVRARAYLTQAVRQSPNSAQAWYWLGKVLDDPKKQKYCFERAAQLGEKRQDEPEAQPSEMAPLEAVVEEPVPGRQFSRHSPTALMVVIGSGLALLLAGWFGLSLFLPNLTRAKGAPTPVSIVQPGGALTGLPAPIPTGTRTPGATRTPTRTKTPTVTRTPTVTPSQTPTFGPTELYRHLGFQITAARMALDAESSAECIRAYDKLLSDMPNWAIGYYNRGICKRQASEDTHDLSEYEYYLKDAIIDQDQATALNPGYSNAYMERAFDYMNLREGLDNFAEDKLVLDIAEDNLRAALKLNTTHFSAPINKVILPIHQGRCREALQEGYRQVDPTQTAKDKALLDVVLASAHLCLGEYSQALPLIEEAVSLRNETYDVNFYTAILIGLGENGKAMDVVNASLQRKPTFTGYRYYLRALIDYDQGNIDQAREDLYMGSGYTWYHRGLFAYLEGMLALKDGDTATAVEWLQYADASMHPNEGLWLRQRIRAQLRRMGAPFISPTPAVQFEVTPITVRTNTPTPGAE